jgi:hypothetical protein
VGLAISCVPVVQRPRTPPFHGDDTGSNPVGDANQMNNFAEKPRNHRNCGDATGTNVVSFAT